MKKRILMLASVALLLMGCIIGGTIAYLVTQSDGVVNTFTAAPISCEVVEDPFNGETKSGVNVKNTSDVEAYVRAKLVFYRVNAEGKHIGGIATPENQAEFEESIGAGWEYDRNSNTYVYTKPVAPGKMPENDLISSYTMVRNYGYVFDETTHDRVSGDWDGGRQVIEVMAEAIQATGKNEATGKYAVEEAWSVKVQSDRSLLVLYG